MLEGQVIRQAQLQIAGVAFNDLENLIMLVAVTTAASKFTTFRNGFGTAGYVVPAGKTFRALACRVKVSSTQGTGNHAAVFGYGDTDIGQDSAAAPTTPKYPFNVLVAGAHLSALTASIPGAGSATASASKGDEPCWQAAPMLLNFPTGKYPFVNTDAGASWATNSVFQIFGYEK